MESKQIALGVGDVVFSLAVEEPIRLVGYASSYVVDAPADVSIDLSLCDEFPVPSDPASFVGGVWGWDAHLAPDGKSLMTTSVRNGAQIHLDLDPPGVRAQALISPARGAHGEVLHPSRELALVEVLPLPAVWALSERKGLLLHTCGVAHRGQGLLFMGLSGSGKSTLAALWDAQQNPHSYVINDEHAILSGRNGSTLLYGAPWVRGGIEARYARVPLRVIFFLVHGQHNRAISLSPVDALARLLSQVFLPVWDQRQLNLVMDACADLVGRVPAFQLEFVPEPATVGFVREFVEARS